MGGRSFREPITVTSPATEKEDKEDKEDKEEKKKKDKKKKRSPRGREPDPDNQ